MKLLYKEGSNIKIIHTSKALIQLSESQEEIIYHTKDYIILSSLNSWLLKDVVVSQEKEVFFRGVSKFKLELKHNWFVILNGYFDEVVINSYDSLLAVNPYGCDVLDIKVSEEYRSRKWMKFWSFFQRVSIFTKVSLTIEMIDRNFSNILEMLTEVFKMEVISMTLVISPSVQNKMRNITLTKIRNLIWDLPKLRTYRDSKIIIRNVDQYDGKTKLKRYLDEKLLLIFNPDEEAEKKTFIDHLEIQ